MELDTGGGRMTKEQAKKEYEKIIHDANKKVIAITEEAKKNGTWKPGLDSNTELFEEVNEETRKRVELLKSLID